MAFKRHMETCREGEGPGFIPGSRDLPDEIRTTAWDFMGQQVPQNYIWKIGFWHSIVQGRRF